MRKIAAIWPVVAMVGALALVSGFLARTYAASAAPFATSWGVTAYRDIAVQGSIRNAAYGYQRDFQLSAGGGKNESRFRYRTDGSDFQEPPTPWTDSKIPYVSFGWSITVPEDAQYEVTGSDVPSDEELDALKKTYAMAYGAGQTGASMTSYSRSWRAKKVTLQWQLKSYAALSCVNLGAPITLEAPPGGWLEGTEEINVTFSVKNGTAMWSKDANGPLSLLYEGAMLQQGVSSSFFDAGFFETEKDGFPYLYYVNGSSGALLPFSAVYGVSLRGALTEGLTTLMPEKLLELPHAASCNLLHFGVYGDTALVITQQGYTAALQTGSLSAHRTYTPLTLDVRQAWNENGGGITARVKESNGALCVRLLGNGPAYDGTSPMPVWHRALSATDGRLLASGDGTVTASSDNSDNKEVRAFDLEGYDALYHHGVLYTVDYGCRIRDKELTVHQAFFSAMGADGPLSAEDGSATIVKDMAPWIPGLLGLFDDQLKLKLIAGEDAA